MKPFAIIIEDQDGAHEYDLIFVVPKGMTGKQAIRKVDAAITATKAADPDGYMFEDLDARLKPQGFKTLSYVNANETW